MEIIVKVKQRHIDEGACGNSSRCAIALALQESGYKKAVVGSLSAFFVESGEHPRIYDVQLPKEACDFIEQFDRSPLLVEPFEFTITKGQII